MSDPDAREAVRCADARRRQTTSATGVNEPTFFHSLKKDLAEDQNRVVFDSIEAAAQRTA